MDGWMDGLMDWMDGLDEMYGWMNGRIDGFVDEQINGTHQQIACCQHLQFAKTDRNLIDF
jgi:hypothetical protein